MSSSIPTSSISGSIPSFSNSSISSLASDQLSWDQDDEVLEAARILMQLREEALRILSDSTHSEAQSNESPPVALVVDSADEEMSDSTPGYENNQGEHPPAQASLAGIPGSMEVLAPAPPRSVDSWRNSYRENQYRDLGLVVGVYEAPPAVLGKVEFPDTKVPTGGEDPSWVYLCYSVLARVPGGKMPLEDLFNTCLEWCPTHVNIAARGGRLTAKRSASRSLSTNHQFFFSENKEYWRLRNIGERVIKFSGPAKKSR